MKICSKCKLKLPIENFCIDSRRSGGRGSHCKGCHNLICIRYLKANKSKRLLHKNNWEKKNPEKVSAQRGRTKLRRKQRDLNTFLKKNCIHAKIKYQIDTGRLKKEFCVVCKRAYKKEVRAHAHHCDYSKPLEVTWLCPKHHTAWHRVFIAEA